MKVAIIGAGISGLYLAWKLSEKGHLVTVFEKKGKIGQEVCSGLFSQRILKFIPHLSAKYPKGEGFIPESRKLIQNKINFVLLRFPKKTIKVGFSKDFLVMSHSELDILVAKLAQGTGAKIILNYNVSAIPKGFDRVIGCDGANSFVRRSLGLPEPKYRLGILGYTEARYLSADRDRASDSSLNYVESWPVNPSSFSRNEKGEGFIWKIPRGKEIEYGIIAESKSARKIFDNFLKENKISLQKVTPPLLGKKWGVKSKIVPQGLIIPSNSSITLCGDAVGLTKPWSGGGVIWGLTAAEILLKTFPDFLSYRKLMRRFFLPKIVFSKVAIKIVYFLGFKMPWFLPKKTRIESDFLI